MTPEIGDQTWHAVRVSGPSFETITHKGRCATFITGDRQLHVEATSNDGRIAFNLSTSDSVASYGTLNGLPIDFSRSEGMTRKDVGFFGALANAYLRDGGVVIMLDHRDDYLPEADLYYEGGAHYALIDVSQFAFNEHHFSRQAHTNIPLPVFTRLLRRGVTYSESGLYVADPVVWAVPDVVDFLNSLFPARVCIAEAAFHRLDAGIGNAGIIGKEVGYMAQHQTSWEDPLCQAGILPEDMERFIHAYNDPSEMVVVRGHEIVLVNLRTESESRLTHGELVGSLSREFGGSTWKRGLITPSGPAYRIYDTVG